MRFTNFAAPVIAAVALAIGGSAVADTQPAIVSFVGLEAGPPMVVLSVTPNMEAVGLPCMIEADGTPVQGFVLAPGPNIRTVPYMGPQTVWYATGPGFSAKWYNPGSN